jgi:dTDP-4-dehydrorhamnose 3,5-epimerase
MILEALPLEGLFKLTPEPQWDKRGFFARCFSRDSLAAAGLVTDLPEWSLSYNLRRGTLRGLHWQAAPYLEAKLVQCIRGAVFDVVVDMRHGSPTRGRWHAIVLSAENRHLLYVPKGFAHGYQTLADDSELLYHISEPFRPECARGVRWNDPDLAVDWPLVEGLILSDRDSGLPLLAQVNEKL